MNMENKQDLKTFQTYFETVWNVFFLCHVLFLHKKHTAERVAGDAEQLKD